MLHSHYGMIIFIQLFCYAQISSASSAFTTKEKPGNWGQQNQQSDFIVNLPHVTTTEVLQHIDDTRADLRKRKTALAKMEKERSFNTQDGAISLVLPGGFLYAAIVKMRHLDAKNRLNDVTKQLNELNQDRLAFRSHSINNTLVATLH